MVEYIDDIEDIDTDQLLIERKKPSNYISLNPFQDTNNLKLTPKTTLPYGIPGTQRIYLKTWGCSHNNSDSEYMAGLLQAYGYKIQSTPENADLWLLNSCTVKGPSQATFLNDVSTAKSRGKRLVLAGCIPQAQKNMPQLSGLSVIGVQQIDRIVEVVEETLKGHSVQLFSSARKKLPEGSTKRYRRTGGAPLNLPKVRRNELIEIIPINTGCLNTCTYCKTKHARGDLGSYEIDEILDRVKFVTGKEGVKEIWLTSEDLGAYGLDIGTNIAVLLEKIIEIIPNDLMLRIGMTNPPYIQNHLKAIARVLNRPNVYSFLHIPVQCGSNGVLEDMKRTYTNEDFCRVVDFMVENVPGILIATDIICGFPTETEADFEETMDLCSKYKFRKLHISQFYPRPNTPAARMKKLPTETVKDRSRRLTKLFESYGYGDEVEGEEITVFFSQQCNVEGNKQIWIGRNKFYQKVQVVISSALPSLLGRYAIVKLKKKSKFIIKGDFVSFAKDMSDSGSLKFNEFVKNGVVKMKRSLFGNSINSKLLRVENRVRLVWMIIFFAIIVMVR